MLITEDLVSKIKLPECQIAGLDLTEYYGPPGKEHYKLLAFLSTFFSDEELFDIGTHQGCSSSALAYNQKNIVHSFDVDVSKLKLRQSNCVYHMMDLWNEDIRELWKQQLLASPLIFLDIAPHDGHMEYEFYQWLCENDYKGILVLDDIWFY